MANSHLLPFARGNSKNTILYLVAKAYGIPLSEATNTETADAGYDSAGIDSYRPMPATAGQPGWAPADFTNKSDNVAELLNSVNNSPYTRLRKHYFDENTRQNRLGMQPRLPHVLYDRATNRIDTLGKEDNPYHYDEDTEQYIIEATQKRPNHRYDFLLPDEAEKRQQEWYEKNHRMGQDSKLNPLQSVYGYNDSYTRNTIGYDYLHLNEKTGAERQSNEDRILTEVAKLAYRNGYDNNFLYGLGRQKFRPNNLALEVLQEFPDMGDIIMQKKLDIENLPFKLLKNSPRVAEIRRERQLGILDAIEEVKRQAAEVYGQYFRNKVPANIAQKLIGHMIEDDGHRAVYDAVYDGITNTPVAEKAEKALRKYLYE